MLPLGIRADDHELGIFAHAAQAGHAMLRARSKSANGARKDAVHAGAAGGDSEVEPISDESFNKVFGEPDLTNADVEAGWPVDDAWGDVGVDPIAMICVIVGGDNRHQAPSGDVNCPSSNPTSKSKPQIEPFSSECTSMSTNHDGNPRSDRCLAATRLTGRFVHLPIPA
jgi:hypothetical protein